ncbi:ATP-binding protein [Dyella sp. ASV21]|uniref:hybrid sensor histidine kinase/response regulator n=1 Tax=Dyella sp. ASV21 TaxID=2795114 RepID=UPI0018EA94DB|nr:ATP-binding protein [Dyella sp. ASV21]
MATLPWFDNEAVALSPVTLALAALLMLTAIAAFVLAWLLRSQLRESRRLQEHAQTQAMLHQETLDALPLPVTLRTLDGRVMTRNRRSIELAGSEQSATDALRGDAFADAKAAVLQGANYRQEVQIPASDGGSHAAYLWVHALREGGQARGYATALLDISEFRDAEQDARQTEQQLADIARCMPIVALVLQVHADGARQLRFVTGDTVALFHLDATELRDAQGLLRLDSLRDRVHPDDLPAFMRVLDIAFDAAPVRTLDFRTFGAHGQRWIHATVASLPDDAGGGRLLGYFIDTTEQNLRNEALRIARDVAERASKAKADFLASMSHEIRTPMNGVIGMLELLGRTPIDAEQRELLRSVEDSASALLQILNDILDFSKLEAGDLRLDPTPFDVRSWLDQVAGAMGPIARHKGLALRFTVATEVAGQLRGDSMRLRQILLNLTNNAIKFTERGSITVRVGVTGDSGSQQQLALSVTDTGIGIAADKQATLFQPFAQAESWTSQRYGGTGLGLAICSQLVELMDGRIALNSELGVGTTVTVELPLPVIERATSTPAALRGRHAIVRVSSAVTANSLESQLRAAGMTVERIDPRQPLRAGMAASLLFIDANDAASAEGIDSHVVQVTDAVVASLDSEGPTLLEAQPLRWRAMLRACLRALELDDADALPPAGPSAAPTLPQLRGDVLVAEDHPVSQRLIARQLALLGLNCDIVDNGRDALEALHGGGYALLLTDGNMPHMSGYELAQAWRAFEAASGAPTRLPILAMTANALSSETTRARQAGMDDVLSKPLQLATLSETLSRWLGARAPAGVTNDDSEDLRHLFADVSEGDLRQLRHHAGQQDLLAATQTMHRLLGVLPLFADTPLLAEGQQLFEALHEPAQAATALPALVGFADRVEQLLTSLRHP